MEHDKSIREALRDLAHEAIDIVRQELRREFIFTARRMLAEVRFAKDRLLSFAAGAFLALLAGFTLVTAVVLLLAEFMPAWAAAFIIAAALGGGAVLVTPPLKEVKALPLRLQHALEAAPPGRPQTLRPSPRNPR